MCGPVQRSGKNMVIRGALKPPDSGQCLRFVVSVNLRDDERTKSCIALQRGHKMWTRDYCHITPVRSPPKWVEPVGDGAKRTRTMGETEPL